MVARQAQRTTCLLASHGIKHFDATGNDSADYEVEFSSDSNRYIDDTSGFVGSAVVDSNDGAAIVLEIGDFDNASDRECLVRSRICRVGKSPTTCRCGAAVCPDTIPRIFFLVNLTGLAMAKFGKIRGRFNGRSIQQGFTGAEPSWNCRIHDVLA